MNFKKKDPTLFYKFPAILTNSIRFDVVSFTLGRFIFNTSTFVGSNIVVSPFWLTVVKRTPIS